MDPRLASLIEVAEMAQQRETAALGALRARIAELQARHRAAAALPPGDLVSEGYAQSGGLALWQRRAAQVRAGINSELARLRAQLPAQERATRRAVGRCVALERLRARASGDARR